MRTIITGILLCVFCAVASGQKISVTASAPKVVRRGEQFALQYQINATPEAVKFPDFTDFDILGESSNSTSTNNAVNLTSYTYYLQGFNVGRFTIPAATFTVQGKTYTSNALAVEVVASASGGSTPSGSSSSKSSPSSVAATPKTASSSQAMYLRLTLDKTTVYQGEPLSASIKLFSKMRINNLVKATFPPFDGFYAHEVAIPVLDKLEREVIGGEAYLTGLLKKYTLFPQKSGDVVIAAASLVATVAQEVPQAGSGFWDDLFGPTTEYVNRTITGPRRVIRVLPLPDGKPASFTGAVGNFTFKVAVDKLKAKTNDAITFVATVSGAGNIRLIDAPKITFPPDFECYDPKTTVSADALDVTGSKTFEYLIIPRHIGTYTIPGVSFSYFDPQTKKYETIVSEGFTFEIEKGVDTAGASTAGNSVTREEVKYLGKDIRYIKTGDLGLRINTGHFFGTFGFWLWFLLPAALFALALWWRRRYIKTYSDHTLRKHLQASKYASKRLKSAKTYMEADKREPFFEEISKALWGYLSDKLNIPVSELSKDTAMDALRARRVSEEAVMDFVVLIDTAEFARYAPSVVGQDIRQVYERAVAMISRMQKELANEPHSTF